MNNVKPEETLSDGFEAGLSTRRALTAAHLFVVLECSRPEAGGSRHSLANIDRVQIGRGRGRTFERATKEGVRTLVLGIPDPRMSLEHACLVRDGGEFVVEDLGSRNGTRLNGAYIVGRVALSDGDMIECARVFLRYRAELAAPLTAPADFDGASTAPGALLGTLEPTFSHQLAQLFRVAQSASPVLLLGETGTGKEVVARRIHECSQRSGPFVAVNCGALPAALLESQLFGYVRGAFSGAIGDVPGLLRSSHGGTLLLDEVGDLPIASQAALLRVLQEHEVVPVGGVRAIPVDLRVIAATHRPLDELVARGDFRSDLFARLAGFTVIIPPLRARREDIGLMVSAFALRRSVRFTPAAGRVLFRYDWPLNVRELYQALDVAATLTDDGVIDVSHLPPAIAERLSEQGPLLRSPSAMDPVREQLVASLMRHRGNVSEVARDLRKARMQVQRWMKRFGIDARSFR
jgi:transcriptional regulator of acetoin/glycerol metabolism